MPEDTKTEEPQGEQTPPIITTPDGAPVSDSPDNAVSTAPAELVTPEVTGPVSPFTAPALVPEPPKAPSKKPLIIIGAVVIGALALIGGGTAAAYNLWYQNPDKIVMEAIGSLLQTTTSTHKVSVDIKTDEAKVKLVVDAKVAEAPAFEADVDATITIQDKDYDVKGSALTDKDGNVYFKLDDLKTLLDDAVGSSMDISALDGVVSKIDGEWIKISSKDLADVSEDYGKQQECIADASKLLDQKATTDEIAAVYKKSPFVIVGDKIGSKTINGVGSLGYKVTFDEEKAKTFYTGLGDTKFGKALTDCDSSYDFKAPESTASDSDDDTKGEIQIWASRFGHQLTEVNISAKNDDVTANIVWNPTFVKGVTVAAPAKSIPLSEVMTDVQTAYDDLYSSSYSYDGSSDFSSDIDFQQQAFKLSSLL